MPGIDGIDLARWLREKTIIPGKSVVIMISAVEWSLIEIEVRKAGVDKFLPKPLFPSAIADIINECVGFRQKQATGLPPTDSISFEGKYILLAEDVEINREIVLALLEPMQLMVDCAETGIEVVKKFSYNPDRYDMILMDVQMPSMDGYEATSRIRALDSPSAKTIPIIALTANVFKEDIEKCLSAGMNDHLGKPINAGELLGKLVSYLSKPLRHPPSSQQQSEFVLRK